LLVDAMEGRGFRFNWCLDGYLTHHRRTEIQNFKEELEEIKDANDHSKKVTKWRLGNSFELMHTQPQEQAFVMRQLFNNWSYYKAAMIYPS
jgi:hypothetical protein